MNRVIKAVENTEDMIRDRFSDPMCPSDIAREFAEDYRKDLRQELEDIPNKTPEEEEAMREYLGIMALNAYERKVYR